MNLLWKLSLRNLLRNRRRSITTGIAITSGFVGLALLGGYIVRVQNGLQANTVYINLQGHLQIRKHNSLDQFSISPKKYLITPELDSEISKSLQKYQEQIEFSGKFLTGSGLLVADQISQPFICRSAEQDIFFKAIHHPTVQKWAKGWIKNADSYTLERLTQHDMISITPRMAEIIGRPRDLKNLTSEQENVQLMTRSFLNDLNAVNARLGLVHTTGIALAEDTSMRMPLKMMQDLLATDGYQYISIFLKNPDQAKKIRDQLNIYFQEQKIPLEAYHFTDGEIGEFYVGTMNFLYVMGAFFVFLICGMVSLSIVNSLTLGILERVRELGTLKALGFSRETIVSLFVRETLWLCLISFGVGLIIAQIVVEIVMAANIQFSPPGVEGQLQFQLAPDLLLYSVIIFVLGAAAVITSYQISKSKLKSSAIELLSEAGV